MKKKQPKWKPIKMGERLPCQSFLRKKDGEILKLSTVAGVKVGQDAYYLPVDDVIEEIKNYPIEESEYEKTKRMLHTIANKMGQHLRDIFTEEEYQCFDAWSNAWLEKQGEQKHQYNSRPRYVGEEELLGEQNHTDKVEPKFKVGDIIKHKERGCTCKITAIDTATAEYGVSECNGTHLPFDFQDAWELVEQKPWSEEDKKLIDDTCHLINTLASGYGEKVTEPISFQGTQMIASIKDRLRALVDNRPQNRWKPTESQLSDLAAIVRQNQNNMLGTGLRLLYEDLKKL